MVFCGVVELVKKKLKSHFYYGTAGWSVPKQVREDFFQKGAVKPNHLKAYAARFTGVEINSSFYREHQASTYLKWAESTPEGFRFSVKLAKRFTHSQKLKVDGTDLRNVLEGISHLGEKLGAVLVQIPPKLSFEPEIAEDFFATLRELHTGPVALEPRHPSWISAEASRTLEEYQIARVVADPDAVGSAPAIKSSKIAYFRLHGAPKMYYSNYEKPELSRWAEKVAEAAREKSLVWCIFDNTALGHATTNALELSKLLEAQ